MHFHPTHYITSYSRYPSSYTPTGTGTCSFTINKCSSDICQLRLDFQTMTGFVTSTANVGSCTDSFAVACRHHNNIIVVVDNNITIITAPTGSDPPTICGTNTGYHSKYQSLKKQGKFLVFFFTQCTVSLVLVIQTP